MIDLVLVRPGLSHAAERHWAIAPPLGLGYLAAAARAAGFTVRVVDAKLLGHACITQTCEEIRRCAPAVVGFSALTVEYPPAAELARQLKQSLPGLVVVLGGAHANAVPLDSLAATSAFDFVITGEGEEALPVLLRAIRGEAQLASVRGLWRRGADGTPERVSEPCYETDLATLPLPAWDLFPRTRVYPVMTARGCPWRCVFCSHNLSTRVRYRPVPSVIEEIRWLLHEYRPQAIYFEDDTFGLHADSTEQLLTELVRLQDKQSVRFKAQTRVDRINIRMLRLMKQAGFDFLELGVESGDPEVLARSGKGVDLQQVEHAVRLAREAGLRVWLKFIVGLPGETEASARRTRALAVRLNPERLSVSVIVAYPGCRVYEWAHAGENGYRLVSRDWANYDKYAGASVELASLSHRQMRRWQARIYRDVYLRNWRLLEFARLAWNHRSLAFAVLRDSRPALFARARRS